jgi:hypothetical protein
MAMPRVLNYKHDGLPPGAVYIGRAMLTYGFAREQVGKRVQASTQRLSKEGAEAIRKYERRLAESGLIIDIDELRGKDLVCWCAPLPRHDATSNGGPTIDSVADWITAGTGFVRPCETLVDPPDRRTRLAARSQPHPRRKAGRTRQGPDAARRRLHRPVCKDRRGGRRSRRR